MSWGCAGHFFEMGIWKIIVNFYRSLFEKVYFFGQRFFIIL